MLGEPPYRYVPPKSLDLTFPEVSEFVRRFGIVPKDMPFDRDVLIPEQQVKEWAESKRKPRENRATFLTLLIFVSLIGGCLYLHYLG